MNKFPKVTIVAAIEDLNGLTRLPETLQVAFTHPFLPNGNIIYATDDTSWLQMTEDQQSKFKLCLTQTLEYPRVWKAGNFEELRLAARGYDRMIIVGSRPLVHAAFRVADELLMHVHEDVDWDDSYPFPGTWAFATYVHRSDWLQAVVGRGPVWKMTHSQGTYTKWSRTC